MKHKIQITVFVILLAFFIGIWSISRNITLERIFASGATYYVSASGADTNTGSQSLPFKTFSKAISVVSPGDTILISGGVYTERLSVTKSGTATSPITIRPVNSSPVIIDLKGTSDKNVDVTGSYINISGLETINSSGTCASFTGQFITTTGFVVHECYGHGTYTDGQHIIIDGHTIYRTNLENSARTMSSGWGSALKVKVGGDDITIKNNTIYHNYGEGIAVTRGKNVVVQNNTLYDNYSENVYIDNSYNVVVEKNFSVCHTNTGYERNGAPANSFTMGEEYYSGWGAQLANITIKNNIGAFCKRGVIYYGADVTGGGLKNTTIVNNTFWEPTSTAISIAYESGKQMGTIIANNIVRSSVGKYAWIENKSGITMSNTFWSPNKPSSSSNALGTRDVVGNLNMASTPGYTPDTYRLSSLSPAIGAGLVLAGVTDDFEGKIRSTISSDMGAIAYSGTIAPTATPVISIPVSPPTQTSTPVPTIMQINETTPPTITIVNPVDGATLPNKGSVKIYVRASDVSGIASIKIYIDNKQVSSCTGSLSCTYSWSVSKATKGTHTISITAQDNAVVQNIGTTISTVTKL